MVMGEGDALHFVAASNQRIRQIQVLQNELTEGPCLQAYRTGQPVAVPDLAMDTRFPSFSPRALEAGLAAVFTFPMRLDEHRLGALDLYRDSPGELDPADQQSAQILADVAAAYLFNATARNEASAHMAALQHRNLHDPLTGLPNRTLFAELIEHAVATARRSHLSAAVLFVDLDRFKSVNDRFGHHAGDLLLRAVADRLGQALRPGDTLARLAGDEFVVLCEGLAEAAAG
jgi:GGDEF domain-containing protein